MLLIDTTFRYLKLVKLELNEHLNLMQVLIYSNMLLNNDDYLNSIIPAEPAKIGRNIHISYNLTLDLFLTCSSKI